MKILSKIKLITPFLMALITVVIVVIASFLVSKNDLDNNYLVGDVKVELEAFYQKGQTKQIIDVEENGGIIELNISDPDQLAHFNNFRVNIIIKSSIYTYFRIALYEQFTLTYMAGNQKVVVAVAKDGYSKFNFNKDFVDKREYDGFFYYKNKVKRNTDESPLVIEFIGELPEKDYHPIYESKYTIQIGFIIEAVQYINGPQMNWGLPNPPWEDNEGW